MKPKQQDTKADSSVLMAVKALAGTIELDLTPDFLNMTFHVPGPAKRRNEPVPAYEQTSSLCELVRAWPVVAVFFKKLRDYAAEELCSIPKEVRRSPKSGKILMGAIEERRRYLEGIDFWAGEIQCAVSNEWRIKTKLQADAEASHA